MCLLSVSHRCTRLCPHSLDKEDGVERHGPVTLNPRHMRKAFKIMNELRRCCTLFLQLFAVTHTLCVTLCKLDAFPSSYLQPEPVVRRDHRGRGCGDRCSQSSSGCRKPLLPRHVHRFGPSSAHAVTLWWWEANMYVHSQGRWQRAGQNEWG